MSAFGMIDRLSRQSAFSGSGQANWNGRISFWHSQLNSATIGLALATIG